jgi:hypothetical protein
VLRSLIAAGAIVAALGSAALWLVDTGYRRGMADCQREAIRIRTEIETRWLRDADRIAETNKERDDAVAAIDAVDAGAAVCLGPDSVQQLKAIR